MNLFSEVKTTLRFRRQTMAWQHRYEPNVPQVGEMAINFTLSDPEGSRTVTLSQFIGQKPVALIFGSFT